EGRLDESNLDGAVERLLTLIFRAQENRQPGFAYDPEAHHALARRAAAEGAVLVKNSGGLLPLRRDTRVAVVGRFAKEPRFQGAGSSYINPTLLDHACDEMEKLAAPNSLGYAPGYTSHANLPDADLICEAMRLARDAEVAVVFAGLPERYEVEGLDREHMHLPPGQDALIEAIAASNPQTVVVLSNGSPVEMPWAGRVSAILEGYLGGQAGGGGTVDILYGEVNPGGKLPETFPLHLEDNPSYLHFPGGTKTVEYRESLYVGYRFYDSVEKDVLFPFGHGLSYTTFEFNSLSFSAESLRDREPLSVYLNVRNTGAVAGAEVVQVYVHDVESTAYRPKKELKGFEKVVLQPGQTAEVCINLDWRAFACYDPALKAWVVEPGDFDILIGASSRDIRLTGRVTVMLDKNTSLTRSSGPAAYHHFPDDADVLREDFAALLGRALPAAEFTVGEAYTINTSIEDMQATFFGRLLGRFFKRRIHAMIGPDQDSPNALLLKAVAAEAPLRTFMMAGNGITYALLEGLVLLINGKIWPGLKAVLAARKVVRR
ncbi:MAG: glycoside hydrolase family 3 C-terminal domain-containing protein, partial [Anaerolineales bacterium]|nr:glycoside hydrolase family 3 C-terminal domain-containing protein [Anaerolineales bacterium]